MRFTEISEKIFELYGINKGDSTSYESFLFDCVLMDDQAYCEQKRLEIMNAKGPAKFKLEFRIIRQNTGAIHKMRVLVQRVEDEEGNLIGLRGAEMDLGIVKKTNHSDDHASFHQSQERLPRARSSIPFSKRSRLNLKIGVSLIY